ncbi:MAG: hypothetical protein HYW98_01250 [Candidatus Wildermuthbacteria bacterium]|nr:hypothetical protein [Candidatus Wildermuthbacteria bacterium]
MAGGLKRIAEEDSFVLSQIQTMRQMGVKEFEGGNHGGVCAGYAGDNPHYPTDPTREEEFHREQGEAAVRVLWKYFGVRLALGYYRPNERGFEFIPLA